MKQKEYRQPSLVGGNATGPVEGRGAETFFTAARRADLGTQKWSFPVVFHDCVQVASGGGGRETAVRSLGAGCNKGETVARGPLGLT
jgi:hypothetical protein